jgi:hypothetical protein
MLLPIGFEQLLLFELLVYLFGLGLLGLFLGLELLVLLYYLLVLPHTPNLVLQLFLLFGGLLDGGEDVLFTPGDLDQLVTLVLLHDHFAPLFLTLVLLLLAYLRGHFLLLHL